MATFSAHPLGEEDVHCVFIDAGPFSYNRLTGLSRYTARLALALSARRTVRYFCDGQELLPPANLSIAQDQDLESWSRKIWRSRRKPLEPIPPNSLGLYTTLRPAERIFPFEVSVLHDFSPCTVPQTHLETTRAVFGEFFSSTLQSSDSAIAVSHSTKSDASWLCPMDPDRVVVAHSGPSLCVGGHSHQGLIRRRQNVGLVVSTLEPRKNARFLLEWFHESDALPDGAELWWVGPLGWLTSRRELKKYESSRRKIRFLGYVKKDAGLCKLYQMAGWSIYPSLYEGFGFPVLDALRHGTPVLASGNSSLREFDSPGLEFFDPYDASTVDSAWRALRAAGAIEIPRTPLDRLYSWDNVARILLELPRKSIVRHDGESAIAA